MPVFEFTEVFNEDYLHFYGPQLEAVSNGQAETIWRLLDLEPGVEVLDLACGHGRIANRLAQRGARVTHARTRQNGASRSTTSAVICGPCPGRSSASSA